MANALGLTVARNTMAGIDYSAHRRSDGPGSAGPEIKQPLSYYASDQVHSCHQKAVELLGLGNKALRRVPSDASLRLDLVELKKLIREES